MTRWRGPNAGCRLAAALLQEPQGHPPALGLVCFQDRIPGRGRLSRFWATGWEPNSDTGMPDRPRLYLGSLIWIQDLSSSFPKHRVPTRAVCRKPRPAGGHTPVQLSSTTLFAPKTHRQLACGVFFPLCFKKLPRKSSEHRRVEEPPTGSQQSGVLCLDPAWKHWPWVIPSVSPL